MNEINYIDLIGKYYTDSIVHTTGDPAVYDDIVWETTPIPQAELDLTYLIELKTEKILEFSEFARQTIIGGFESSALGSPHYYDTEPEDQLNMIGVVTSGTDGPYACRLATQGTQAYTFSIPGSPQTLIEATTPTGLANDTTTYTATINVDGQDVNISVEGSSAQTFGDLVTEINNQFPGSPAIASIELLSGNIVCTSTSYGSSSTISTTDGNLFSSLNYFIDVAIPVDGLDAANGPKEYKWHTHEQITQVLNGGKIIKLQILQYFNIKQEEILAAPDVATVEAITWDYV